MRKIIFLLLFSSLFFPKLALAHDAENAIHITDNGFEPSEITIEKGETVIFENSSKTNLHWPASDLHPTHAIYSEFDPKRGLAPGESWEFKFEKAGKWNMHDHLFPKFVGTINVTGSETPTKETQKPSFIKRTWDDFRITLTKIYFKIFPAKLASTSISGMVDETDRLTFFIKVLGASESMKKLLVEADGGSKFDCHRQAHIIGRVAYEIFGAEVFAKGDSSCHSGFYHGAMETFLHEEGTKDLSEKISKICSSFATNFGNFECLHGVGHGAMAYEDYNLPKAVEICKSLANEFEMTSCYGGVFMENVVASQGGASVTGHTTDWVSSDPHYPCGVFLDDPMVLTECYKMQTSRMLGMFNNDFDRVSEECMKAPSSQVGTCFLSLGRDAAGYTFRDPDRIVAYCSSAPAEYRASCYYGGLNVIVDFWGEKLGSQGEEFCGKLSGEHQPGCLTQLASRKVDVFGN